MGIANPKPILMAPAKNLRLSLLIFLILYLCSCTPRAYVSRDRTLALKGMKLDTALQLIDRAKQDKKIAGEAKTCFVEGFIYQKMHEAGGKEYTQGNFLLLKAFDSYSKAYEINNIYGLREGFAEIHQFLMDEGIKAYEQKDYSTALPILSTP